MRNSVKAGAQKRKRRNLIEVSWAEALVGDVKPWDGKRLPPSPVMARVLAQLEAEDKAALAKSRKRSSVK